MAFFISLAGKAIAIKVEKHKLQQKRRRLVRRLKSRRISIRTVDTISSVSQLSTSRKRASLPNIFDPKDLTNLERNQYSTHSLRDVERNQYSTHSLRARYGGITLPRTYSQNRLANIFIIPPSSSVE
jgi:hypothetical protein